MKVYWKDVKDEWPYKEDCHVLASDLGGSPADWGRVLKGLPVGGFCGEVLKNIKRYGYEAISEYNDRQRAVEGGYSEGMEEIWKSGKIFRPVFLRKKSVAAKFGGVAKTLDAKF